MFGRRRKDDEPAPDAEEPQAPGWDAIDELLGRTYGDQVPRHVGYPPPPPFSDNLNGCSAYAVGDHWHFITYGLSELYVPVADADPAVSGLGLELTLRTKRGSSPAAPGWPFTMINEMAKHVRSIGGVLRPGDRIDLQQPVTGYPSLPGAPDTDATVFAVAIDPVLGQLDTPNGRVEFLQLVGVTAADKQRMIDTSTQAVLDEQASQNPLHVLDV